MSSYQKTRYLREGLGRRGLVPRELQKVPSDERPHLSKKHPTNDAREWAGMTARKDEPEFYCGDCRARITVSPNEQYEYGHDRGSGGGNRVCKVIFGDFQDSECYQDGEWADSSDSE